MKKITRFFLAFLFVCTALFSTAQKSFFSDVNESRISNNNLKRTIIPQKYRTVSADMNALRSFLWSLPSDRNNINRRQAPIMELPMPDGSTARFHVWESSIQEPGLEALFPEIKTFEGQGIDDPYATIRFDYTGFGFHAQIISINGNIYVDPYARGNTNNYIVYYNRDNRRSNQWECGVTETIDARAPEATAATGPCQGGTLRTYRVAVACTGEYAVAVGGTTATLLHSAIVTTVNRVVGVYMTELSVKLVLVANNNLVEFLNASTDPFNGNNNANTLITESQTQITSRIGSANFDIGHTFSTGGGGLAGLGVVCVSGSKARGITGSPSPTGDGYDIDYVAHEMGHQFGGNHTFNSSAGNCSGNRNASTAYEVGSGTSIMAYAGICSTDDTQPHSDPYFHTISFDEISNFITTGSGSSCAVTSSTGNANLPQITSMLNNGVTIPVNTPFTLTATATDADGDPITYDWEEWDLGSSTVWNGGASSTTAPVFKSRIPKTSGSRTFPDPGFIAANYVLTTADQNGTVMNGYKGETLPTVARALKFRLTVRDNRAGGGGVVTGGNGCQSGFTTTFQINTSGTSPFAVTIPNGGQSWAGNSTQTITWNVVGTTASPFNVANVKISLSTDGGLTFPTVIAASTANDGTEAVTIPNTPSTTARIKVEAIGNIFFDISNANFTITAGAATLTTISTSAITPLVYCAGATVSVPFTTNAAATAGNVFKAQLSNSGGSFASPVEIGTLTSTAAGTITATIPTGTGSGTGYRIRVISTTPAVTGSDNGSNITINTAPAAATITAGGATTFCSGGSVVLSGNANGGTWSPGGGTGSTLTVTTSGEYYVTNTNNCGSTQSNHIIVTVNPLPTASTISAGGATTFCNGGSVVLSGNTNGGVWSPGGSTASTLTVTTSGEYYVTNSNGCGSVQSNHIVVTVNPSPTASTISAGGATTICSGSSVLLSGNNNGGVWTPGGSTAASLNVTTTGEYYVTNTNGCGSIQSNHITVTVNPLPSVSAGSYGPYTTASPAVTLTGTPSGGTFSGTGVSGNTFNPATAGVGTFTINYQYTNANGCTAIGSTNITVNPAGCTFSVGTISGPGGACPYMGPLDGDATYTIAATGASGYTWGAPANASIVSGQGTNTAVVHFTSAFTSGYLNVTVGNACGGTSALVKLSVKATLPSVPGAITGPTGACAYFINAATYTIRKVANSTSYEWTVPAGATITGHPAGTGINDTSITVLYNNSFVSGTAITVKGVSFCGTSTSARSLTITRTNPSVPGAITGPTDACPYAGTGVQATYTIRSQVNASSYIWTVPANASIVAHPAGTGANDTIIRVSFTGAYTTGAITVAAANSCSTTAVRSLTVNKTLPGAPTKIYGDPNGADGPLTAAATDACPYVFSNTNAVYSINRIRVTTDPSGYASGYNWVLSDAVNAHIVSHPAGTGANDTVIVVHFDNAYTTGTVQVQSLRACGASAFKSVTVTKKIPTVPDPISGATSPCPSTIGTYTVTAANATNYVWTGPATVSFISGQGTPTVQIQFASNFNGGIIRVTTNSACGTSSPRSLTLTKCVPRPMDTDLKVPAIAETMVYPNPSNGNFRIMVSNASNLTAAKVVLMNEFGQAVYNANEQVRNGAIDVKAAGKLTSGIYFVHCIINGEKTIRKIIINR